MSKTKGSWLISETISVFEDLHQYEDIEMMFKLITENVAEQRSHHVTDDGVVEAVQVPVRQSTLRKKFMV